MTLNKFMRFPDIYDQRITIVHFNDSLQWGNRVKLFKGSVEEFLDQ